MQNNEFINKLKEYDHQLEKYTYENRPNCFLDLTPDIQVNVLSWIALNITKRKTANYNHSCYGLKHMLPFYINSGAFKGAMIKAGYIPVDVRAQNWNFRINVKRYFGI